MLSDAKARKAQPGEKDYKLIDEKGLFLLVRPNGSKLWRHRYRVGGKEKMGSYGPYPEVSIRDAREKRDETREILRQGRDPAIEARKAAAAAVTDSEHSFESLAREWHELNRPRWVPRHCEDVITSLERDVFPMLGEFAPGELTAPLILACLRQVENRGAIETAGRLRQRIDAVLSYGLSMGLIATNPAAMVKGALKPVKKGKRQPAVTDLPELHELLRKSEASGAYPVTLLASRFLAITAQRPGTVRGARWEDMKGIDWNCETGPKYTDPMHAPIWHIPAEQMKLTAERKEDEANDHIVPLPPAAVEALRAVRALSGRGKLCFPGQRHAHRPLSENAIGYLYNRVGWHGRHVPHGWRAAFSSIMNERRPADRKVIDMMLAHANADRVEAAYNRAEHMALRREIAEEWAGLVMEGARAADDLLTVERRLTA